MNCSLFVDECEFQFWSLGRHFPIDFFPLINGSIVCFAHNTKRNGLACKRELVFSLLFQVDLDYFLFFFLICTVLSFLISLYSLMIFNVFIKTLCLALQLQFGALEMRAHVAVCKW
jgi:hypothetical protein